MPEVHYAHTRPGPIEDWQPLEEHLDAVAELAAYFADAFGSAEWARLAGLWHDIGKYADDFQYYLGYFADKDVRDVSYEDGRPGRVDHSTAGAVHLLDRCAGHLYGSDADKLPAAEAALAMVLAGHHSGLPESKNFEPARLMKSEKRARLKAARDGGASASRLDVDLPALPPMLARETFRDPTDAPLRYDLWTRMLFSTLIDADRLDTEHAMNEAQADRRRGSAPDPDILPTLSERVDVHLAGISAKAAKLDDLGPEARRRAEAVLKLRADVLAACRGKAPLPPGRRSLTVPTGGGKTLAALSYALQHAIKNDLRRVIVVIPFTSIIDQTAAVYREAFGDLAGALVEHHSNLDPDRDTAANRFASENWDAPVVVTTSVQFFESLFTARGTPARKLHNIAKSVVVFDEVQALPHGLRAPIFDVLNQLVDFYHVSALFCTATQPALGLSEVNRQNFPYLEGVEEVVADVPAAFAAVRDRVVADFSRVAEPTPWVDLAAELTALPRVLTIVQRRDDARDLCQLVPDAHHLSARMCPAHRREVLKAIREALKRDGKCRVISTTLVEAGVDLDFPVVYRALGGVDALAQAAGRCNREGRLVDDQHRPIPGRLVVFRSPTEPPRGSLRLGASTTSTLLSQHADLDLFDPVTCDRYFDRYLGGITPDERNVMAARLARDFPEVEKRFQMIDDQGRVSVVVPYGDAEARVAAYRVAPNAGTLRGLQPFVVDVSLREAEALGGLIETIND